jgi:uncharacterized repeat protein (TIGR01451 family)
MQREGVAAPMQGYSVLRSRTVLGVSAVLWGAGLLSQRVVVFALGTLTVGYWLVPRVVGPPEAGVELRRELVGRPTEAGDTVTVTTTVRNTGRTALYGVSVAEGIPESVPVAGETRMQAARLAPGATRSLEYVVGVRPGTHEYAPARVTASDWSGQYTVDAALPVETVLVWSDSDEPGADGRTAGADSDGDADRDRTVLADGGPDSADSTNGTAADSRQRPQSVVCLDAQWPSGTAGADTAGIDALVDCAVTASHELPGPVWLAVVDAIGGCHVRRQTAADPAAWLTERLATPETPTGVWPEARREGPASPGIVARTLADAVPQAARLYLVRDRLDDRVVRLADRLADLGYDVVVIHPRHATQESWCDQSPSLGTDTTVDVIEWSPNTTLRHAEE